MRLLALAALVAALTFALALPATGMAQGAGDAVPSPTGPGTTPTAPAAPTTTPAPAPSRLPNTGGPVDIVGLAGLGLVLAGVGLRLSARVD